MTININELRRRAEGGYKVASDIVIELLDRLEAAEKERDALRAKIEQMERQEPVAWMDRHGTLYNSVSHVRPSDKPLFTLPSAQPAPSTEYVGRYCAHCERGVDASEVTYHEQHQVCGRIITDDKPPKPAPSDPEGWLRAIDEALVTTHIGIANAHDTYEQAKAKLDNLIGFNIDIATDPAVNGGWKLVPIEPTEKMVNEGSCASTLSGPRYISEECAKQCWEYMIKAAPEAKPDAT